jgi:hypothetical protein
VHYKPDWEEAREQHIAWWNGSHLDHVTLGVMAPRESNAVRPQRPTDMKTRWLDPDYRIAEFEYRFETEWFGGAFFPYFDTQLGPGSLALYLGCPGVLQNDTVWYRPLAKTPAEVPQLRFDPENEWWKAHVRLCEEGVRRGEGRYLTGYPDLIENIDIVSSLVGNASMLYAMIDDPESVKRLVADINDLFFEYYDALFEVLKGQDRGTCYTAFDIWGPGRAAKVQCDACAMFSPDMFDEFVGPGLTDQTNRLDHSVYHLDGPDAVRHVNSLVQIPKLNAIQWTPGAGHPSVGHESYWPMYDQIRKAGKGLLLLGCAFEDVEPLTRHLGPDGVYIGTTAPSIEAGEGLLRKAHTW